MTTDVEIVVVGAGAVGLAIARTLAMRGREVLVLERNARAGMETSSRNSEVIHAGLYYPPGSLKARLCHQGSRQLYDFCARNGVACRQTGKLLVATERTAVDRLAAIADTARQNGVDDIVPLIAEEARGLESNLACAAALLSPSTGVIDSHGFVLALEGEATSSGAGIVLNTTVDRIDAWPGEGFALATNSAGTPGRITTDRVVIAAGLGASRLGATLSYAPAYRVPETVPAKGHYFALAGPAPFARLIYPLPGPDSLGIHFTRDVAGAAKFGPDIEWPAAGAEDAGDYRFDDADGRRRDRFLAEIARFWPDVRATDLTPAYTGLRPKIHRPGTPAVDFAIHTEADHGVAGLVALYGIESPGLTASLAIADHVARVFT